MATETTVRTLRGRSQTPYALHPPENMWRRLRHHHSAQVGSAILAVLVFLAVFAPVIAPYDPLVPLSDSPRRTPPCIHLLGCPAGQPEHIFGLDGNSRDLFSRVLYGAQLSLKIGLVTISFGILVGAILGAVAGFAGGWADNVIMRLMDVLLAFPALLLAIAIMSMLGTGLINALIAIAIVSIPVYARVLRSRVLEVKQREFVTAARSIGVLPLRILWVHILPNSIAPLIVQGTLGIAAAVLSAASLSFLGLGAQPPTPEWGMMLGEERNSIFNAPHLVVFPGLAIMLTVLGFNLLGDGLRDVLDPRLD